MPKREPPPETAPDGTSDGSASFERHPLLSEEATTVGEHFRMYSDMTTPLLLAQVSGIAARLQFVSAAIRFSLGSDEPSHEQERRFCEDIKNKLHIILPDVTDAVTTLLALEAVLCERYVTVTERLDALPAHRSQRRRRE